MREPRAVPQKQPSVFESLRCFGNAANRLLSLARNRDHRLKRTLNALFTNTRYRSLVFLANRTK